MRDHPPSAFSHPPPVLEVCGVSKRFSTGFAVRDLTFSMASGEILGLLGSNGAGKTTTIQMLISVLAPDRGSIRVLGRDLARERSAVLQQVAFASTYTNLPLFLTIQENLDVHGRLYSIPGPLRRARIDEMLERFSVQEHRHKRVGQLSAGQRTRVMLAKAFLPRPKLALLDEPTASLDPEVASEVRKFVAEERREQGTAVLFSSHNMAEVTTLCDRVLFLREGRMVAMDTPRDLAASVGNSVMELKLEEGIGAAEQLLREQGRVFELLDARVSIQIRTGEEGQVLVALTERGVRYSSLVVHHPTLEDYFLLQSREGGGAQV